MDKTYVNPPDLYQTPWKFNQAIKVTGAGSLVFLSGIVGYEVDGTLPKDIVTQARNAYASMQRVIEDAGGTMADIVKTNVYVGEDYQIHRDELRDIRAQYFDDDGVPATTLLRVAGFAQTGYLFEIEAIAVLAE